MKKLSIKLAEAPVFRQLTPEDRKKVAQLAILRTYQKGEFLCWQDEVWPKVLYIDSGRLDWLMLSPSGKRLSVFQIQSGGIVWAHSIFDEQPMPASLRALTRSIVYQWSAQSIMPIVSRNVDAVWEIASLLVHSMRHVREVVYGYAFHSVSERLARLLLSYYQPEEGQAVPRDLTLDEMAAIVGSTRELVCKILYRFAKHDLLQIHRRELVFTDIERLHALASGQDRLPKKSKDD